MNIRNSYIWTAEWRIKCKEDPRSYQRNLCSCEKKAWKNQACREPWPLRYRCSALTNWANKPTGSWSLNWFVIYPGKMKMKLWIYEIHIFELRNEECKEDPRSYQRNLCSCEKKAWKNQACWLSQKSFASHFRFRWWARAVRKKMLSSTCGQVYKTCSLSSDQKRNSNINQTNKHTNKQTNKQTNEQRFLRISHFPANKKTAEKTLTWFLMSNRKIKNRCDREFHFPFLILIRTLLRLLLQALRMCGLHPRNTWKPRENVITSARITCLCFSIVTKHLKTLVSARKHSEDFGCLFR